MTKHLTLQLNDETLFDIDYLRKSKSRYQFLQKLVENEVKLLIKLDQKRGLIT